jgi:hypothetical protein
MGPDHQGLGRGGELTQRVARIERKRNPGLTRRLASAGCCTARLSRMSQVLHPGYALLPAGSPKLARCCAKSPPQSAGNIPRRT